jgi:hypothetical protein
MPWHFLHRMKHACIVDAAVCQLRPHHAFALELKWVVLERDIHVEWNEDAKPRAQ